MPLDRKPPIWSECGMDLYRHIAKKVASIWSLMRRSVNFGKVNLGYHIGDVDVVFLQANCVFIHLYCSCSTTCSFQWLAGLDYAMQNSLTWTYLQMLKHVDNVNCQIIFKSYMTQPIKYLQRVGLLTWMVHGIHFWSLQEFLQHIARRQG